MSKRISICIVLVMCSARAFAQLPIEPSPRDIAALAFDCQRDDTVRDLNIDMVVDNSKSMAGFLRVAGGNYRRLLSAVTDLRVASRVTIRSLSRPALLLRLQSLSIRRISIDLTRRSCRTRGARARP